jgi:hypothetical protein
MRRSVRSEGACRRASGPRPANPWSIERSLFLADVLSGDGRSLTRPVGTSPSDGRGPSGRFMGSWAVERTIIIIGLGHVGTARLQPVRRPRRTGRPRQSTGRPCGFPPAATTGLERMAA